MGQKLSFFVSSLTLALAFECKQTLIEEGCHRSKTVWKNLNILKLGQAVNQPNPVLPHELFLKFYKALHHKFDSYFKIKTNWFVSTHNSLQFLFTCFSCNSCNSNTLCTVSTTTVQEHSYYSRQVAINFLHCNMNSSNDYSKHKWPLNWWSLPYCNVLLYTAEETSSGHPDSSKFVHSGV